MNSRRVLHLLVSFSLLFQSSFALSLSEVNTQSVQAVKVNAEAATAVVFASPLATPTMTPMPLATPIPQPAVLATPTPTPVTTTLILSATEALVDARGGRVSSADRRIQLDVPPGLLQRNTRVRIAPRGVASQVEAKRPLIEFDLDALDVGTNARLSQFNRPLTLTVNLTGLLDLNQVPSNMYVALYTVSPEGNQIPVWPIQIDAAAGTVSAQIDHFSSWGAGLYPGTPGVWEFNYTAPEVALYSGAAAAQIPLKVPAGRNGLQPNLGLSYNSATLNGVSGSALASTDWTRGSALGGFWEVDGFAKIAREKWDSCKWGTDPNWNYTSCFKDVFTLILDGTGYNLVPAVEGQTYGQYYAEGGPAMFVYRYNNCAAHNTETGRCTTTNPTGNPSLSNETGEWWLVRLPDGTSLELGKTIDAEQVAGNICNPVNDATTMRCKKYDGATYGMGYRGSYAGAANGNPSKAARAWWVNAITDTSGNTMEFAYGTFWFNNGEHVTPRTIRYNGTAGNYLTRIELVGTDNNPPNNEPTIDRIDMFTRDANSVEQLVRRYWFTRAWFNRNKSDGSQSYRSDFEVLTGVQEEGLGGARLPAQTFTYEWRNTRDPYDLMQLTVINNGYGGVTTFDYVDDMRPYGGYCNWAGCNDYVISSRRISTGGGSPDLYTTYEYGQVCHDAYNPGGPTECASRATILCGLACDYDRFVKLSGFGVVTATQWDGSTAAARNTHYFKNANPAWLKGRETRVEQLEPANNNAVLTRQETTWSDKWNGAWFAFVGDQTSTSYDGGSSASTRTSYAVDSYNNVTAMYDYGAEVRVPNAGFEGNVQSWNTWKETPSCSFTADNSDVTQFAGRWSLRMQGNCGGAVYQDIAGLVPNATYTARVWVRRDTPSDTAGFTLFMYDPAGGIWYSGSPSLSTSFSQVSVDFVASSSGNARIDLHYWTGSGKIYVDEMAIARASDVGDERSTWRSYHNLVDNGRWFIGLKFRENTFSTITPNVLDYALLKTQALWYYDEYTYNPALYLQTSQINRGKVTMEGRGLYSHAPDPYVTMRYLYDQWGNPLVITDTRGNPTRAEYDSQYHMYTVAITNALAQPTRYTYNVVSGTLTSVTDLNNAVTHYRYDAFGRLTKVIKPGDSEALPTTEYRYAMPNGDVHGLQTYQREVSGVGSTDPNQPYVGTLVSVDWFDGLGRTYQTRREGAEPNVMIVQDLFYDALGRTIAQSVPYSTTAGGRYATPADLSQPRSLTHYDALGRADTITNTDGTTVTTKFKGWQTAMRDANGHLRISEADAFGRLSSMREYTQAVGSITPAMFDLPAYATTRYTYDVLGNLKVVTDALQNTTLINYDALGRKTEMFDPDMGHWTYQYDPAGNLITQTDALTQVLWFNYDPLNRLMEKRQTNSSGLLLAKYTYGSVTPNIGYRLRMDDLSGYATWAYDIRGRVTQETKAITINNTANIFVTGLGYDALDRVITTTYPTGEMVTQTYNAMGTLENVRSASSAAPYANQWYVQNLDYNAQGALTLAQLGNNVNTIYTYDPLNFRLKTLNVSGLYRLQYGYDNVGNVLSWTSLYTMPNALTESMQYQYDALDRLTRAIPVTNGYTGTFTYDQIGDLKTKTETGATITYTYGVTQPHAVRSLTNGWLYTYDLNGNMKTRLENGVTYQQQWDMENRLTVVTNTSTMSVTRFVYDGDGARVLQIKPDEGQTVYIGGLMEIDLAPTVLPALPGWSGRITRQENGEGVGGALVSLIKREVCPLDDGTLEATVWWPEYKAESGTGVVYVFTSRGEELKLENNQMPLVWDEKNNGMSGFLSLALPPGSYQAYVKVTDGSITQWSAVIEFAINGKQATPLTFQIANETEPSVGPTEPLPYISTTTITTVLATTTTTATGLYQLSASGITYNEICANSLRLVETVPANFTAQSASAPAPGTVLSSTEIQYPAVSGGETYPRNNFTLSSSTIPTTGAIKKVYYHAGAQLIAMRVITNGGSALYFLHGDHLGSTSLTTDQNGNAVARQLYDAWGNIRPSGASGTMPTDVGYTGQRLDATGLMYYRARYYDSSLNRFISADTIVPSPSNPQSLNRFSYGLNNPIRYDDPTGHDPSDRVAIVQKIIDDAAAAAAAGNMEMANALYQDAINQAIDLWQINLGSESESIATYNPLYGMISGSPDYESEAGTDRLHPRHPISVGPRAFKSVAWLVSTLKHEGVHRIQYDEGRGQIPSGNDTIIAQHLSLIEVEAYDCELAEANDSGLSVSEIQDIEERRKNNYMNLEGWFKRSVDNKTYNPKIEVARALYSWILNNWLRR